MSKSLGKDAAGTIPPATRVARTGWRDPRLWIGVLLLCASVVAGARLLATVDDTVAVWAAGEELGVGADITAEQLVTMRVRFNDDADLERYFLADDELPDDLVVKRGVGAGELLPRAAVGARADSDLLHVPIEVVPQQVPGAVTTGSVIDVYLSDASGSRDKPQEGAALSEVTVVDAPPVEESFAVTGTRQLVVAVPEEDAEAFQEVYATLDDPSVRVVQRS